MFKKEDDRKESNERNFVKKLSVHGADINKTHRYRDTMKKLYDKKLSKHIIKDSNNTATKFYQTKQNGRN